MPTVFSHAIVGLAISAAAPAAGARARLALAAAACAVVPDLDVVTIWIGVRWGHVLGHRGLSHSLLFAAVLAALVVALGFRGRARGGVYLRLWLVLFVATASHGILDAMTDGGPGVAFLAPWDRTRYFLPWRPIPVSPIGISRFFGARGLDIMQAEVVLIWLPTAIVLLAVLAWRWRRGGRR
jgi:inner membrane protein